MNEELKPCPFCGKECYHVQYKDGMQWCFNCLHCPMEYYTDIEDEQEAIKAFNTRHHPPQANGKCCDNGNFGQANICPHCGYCPTCGRPWGNFNYPQQPYPINPYTQPQVWYGSNMWS